MPVYMNGEEVGVVNDMGGSSIVVDDHLSTTSKNPVQNKVITQALNNKQDTLIAGTGITINNNVISAQGGGSGSSFVPQHITFIAAQNVLGDFNGNGVDETIDYYIDIMYDKQSESNFNSYETFAATLFNAGYSTDTDNYYTNVSGRIRFSEFETRYATIQGIAFFKNIANMYVPWVTVMWQDTQEIETMSLAFPTIFSDALLEDSASGVKNITGTDIYLDSLNPALEGTYNFNITASFYLWENSWFYANNAVSYYGAKGTVYISPFFYFDTYGEDCRVITFLANGQDASSEIRTYTMSPTSGSYSNSVDFNYLYSMSSRTFSTSLGLTDMFLNEMFIGYIANNAGIIKFEATYTSVNLYDNNNSDPPTLLYTFTPNELAGAICFVSPEYDNDDPNDTLLYIYYTFMLATGRVIKIKWDVQNFSVVSNQDSQLGKSLYKHRIYINGYNNDIGGYGANYTLFFDLVNDNSSTMSAQAILSELLSQPSNQENIFQVSGYFDGLSEVMNFMLYSYMTVNSNGELAIKVYDPDLGVTSSATLSIYDGTVTDTVYAL